MSWTERWTLGVTTTTFFHELFQSYGASSWERSSRSSIAWTYFLIVGFGGILWWLALILLLVILVLAIKRWQTYRTLRQGGLPTVFWRPKFINYRSTLEENIDDVDFDSYDCTVEEPDCVGSDPRVEHDIRTNQSKCAHNGTLNNGMKSYKKKVYQRHGSARTHTNRQKLSSSTITNMLPRMERLQGPYGMYGTVYGVSTAVIHVAHPVPARAVLQSLCSTSTSSSPCLLNSPTSSQDSCSRKSWTVLLRRWRDRHQSQSQQQRRGILQRWQGSGATKSPAYNHFFNFCGQGVFTADGPDWQAKRAAVMHALFPQNGTFPQTSSTTAARRYSSNNKNDDEPNGATGTTITTTMQESLGASCSWEHAVEVCAHTTANELIHRLRENANQSLPVPVNVVPLLQRATFGFIFQYLTHKTVADLMDDADLSIVNGVGTGRQGTSKRASSRSNPHYRSMKTLLTEYCRSILRIRMIILAHSRSLWFTLPRWCYRWLSPMYREEERVLHPIRCMSFLACQQAVSTSPLAQFRCNHLYQASAVHHGSKNESIVSKNLLDEVVTLLFAGQDTTAATLSWTLHLLSLHINIQTQLANQIRDALRTDEDQHILDATLPYLSKRLVSKMPLLDAVIKESMRLFPVAPFVVRRLVEPITLPAYKEPQNIHCYKTAAQTRPVHDEEDLHCATHGSGSNRSTTAKSRTSTHDKPIIFMPSGAVVCIWIHCLHRNAQYWHDPNEYRPERWLPNTSTKDGRIHKADDSPMVDDGISCGAYLPFATGPRNCIGQPIAQIVLRCLLARLIYALEFVDPRLDRMSTDTVVDHTFYHNMQAGFTVLPDHGVPLLIRERRWN